MPLKCVEFTSSGTWTPPVGVTAALVVATASGGGANGGLNKSLGFTGLGECGAASGEFMHAFMIPVSHSSPLTITIGVGGVGTRGVPNTAPYGHPGNPSSIGSWSLLGAGQQTAAFQAAAGGGPNGGAYQTGQGAPGTFGAFESSTHYGGMGGGTNDSTNGLIGGSAADTTYGAGGVFASGVVGGGGGAGNLWAQGGNGGNGNVDGAAATGYGTGGGGGGGGANRQTFGGSGANGYVAVFYMAP